jgi:Domain of unknown function (DUF3471).
MRFTRPGFLAALFLIGTASSRSVSAQEASLLTTVGADTLCFEHYVRHGNVVTGSWVVLHAPGVYVHNYRITLGADGRPVHYSMKYSVPVSLESTPPALDSVVLDYERDTVTYTFVSRDSTFTHKVALHEAFPFLGQSMVGLDLGLRRLRAAHADSGVIVANETSNLVTPARTLNVRLAGDSAYVGPNMRVRLAPDGGVLDLQARGLVVHQAPSLDVAQLTKYFVDEYAPRVAALRQAAASRVEISLPADQLDRFVGRYGRGAAVVTRDGDHLVATLGGQAKFTLLAMSKTSFFVRRPDLVFTFEIDSTGSVQGLTIAQGDSRQPFPRDN